MSVLLKDTGGRRYIQMHAYVLGEFVVDPCTLNRSRGFDFLSGSEEINVQELLAMVRTEA